VTPPPLFPLRSPSALTRRSFIAGTVLFAAAALLSTPAAAYQANFENTPLPQDDDNKPPSPVLMDLKNTLTGNRPRDWFFNGLELSASTWHIVAQQIMVVRVDGTRNPEVTCRREQWPRYRFARRRMLRNFHDAKIKPRRHRQRPPT
jgi:phosphodiesterase/alkaline phosphatase D-like protein